MVFNSFRQSFDELLSRATRPEERRAVAARMKDTLVQAKLGLNDMRDGLEKSRQRLSLEERELETVRRRKQLAEGIGDRETVDIAAKYEQMHAERVEVLRQKVSAQEAELVLAQRDVDSMSAELKAVLSGAGPGAARAPLNEGVGVDEEAGASSLRDEIDSLGRTRARADREAEAARRLDELKRRMGK
jgi:hypothetical protein